MADRQWVGWSGAVVHEEGDEEFVTWSGAIISEDQAAAAATVVLFRRRIEGDI